MTCRRALRLALPALSLASLCSLGCDARTGAPSDSGSAGDDAVTIDGGPTLDAGSSDDAARTVDAFRAFDDAGCASAPTFADVDAAIFSVGCSGPINCHGGGSHLLGGGLALTDPGTYDMLVGAASSADPTIERVAPSDPGASLLYRKLVNDLPADGSLGGPMPSGEGILWHELPADQIELVRCWIATGASR